MTIATTSGHGSPTRASFISGIKHPARSYLYPQRTSQTLLLAIQNLALRGCIKGKIEPFRPVSQARKNRLEDLKYFQAYNVVLQNDS